jgi:hypothetical protein
MEQERCSNQSIGDGDSAHANNHHQFARKFVEHEHHPESDEKVPRA